MSFMFNPHPYNEKGAVNHPVISNYVRESLKKGNSAIVDELLKNADNKIIVFDGYTSASFSAIVNMVAGKLKLDGEAFELINITDYFKDAKVIEDMLSDNLKVDLEKDPINLFGKREEDGYGLVFDKEKVKGLFEKIANRDKVYVIYGNGSAYYDEITDIADIIVWFDVAPKNAVLRAKNGDMINAGDKVARPFREMMRRAYYVDFEAALTLRRKLIHNGKISFYIDSTDLDNYKMLDKQAFEELTQKLSIMPFRNKPVYLEGVWGGQYIKSLRQVDEMKNIAWVFDFIPMEVSIVAEIGEDLFEMPFYTLLQAQEKNIMGELCVDKFGGYFPIRFNYDDTFHSAGNMSIQVHSDSKYNKENFNEFGRQDESYYIINAGHGAKTYLGFNDDIDPDEFVELAKESEINKTEIDYQKYINAVESKPGVQVMIPAGTIHASGRNQLILEIGSLTVGSYTYKLYDYLRLDLDGKPRPIHSYHGERVLHKERNTTWINQNVVQAPRVIREGDGFKESIIGEHDLLYFSLRHLEFEKEIRDNTNGKFHVLSLVNGEHVMVQSVANPELCYYQNFLDIIVVPASIGEYRIVNLGNQPITIHKTCLKDGFENDQL